MHHRSGGSGGGGGGGIAGRTRHKKALAVVNPDQNEVVALSSDDDGAAVENQETTQTSNDAIPECGGSDGVERGRGKRKVQRIVELKATRRRKFGLDVLIDENSGNAEEMVQTVGPGPALRTRSHFRRNRKLKLGGTLNQPICINDDDDEDEEEEEGGGGGGGDEEEKRCRGSGWSDEEGSDGDCESEKEMDDDPLWRKWKCSSAIRRNKHAGERLKGDDTVWESEKEIHDLFGRKGSAFRRNKHSPELKTRVDLRPTVKKHLTCQRENPEPEEKSEQEKQLEALWMECDYCLSLIQDNYVSPSKPQVPCRVGRTEHDIFLDDEIGLRCACCPHIQTEIKDVDIWPFVESPDDKRKKRDSYVSNDVDPSVISELQDQVIGDGDDAQHHYNYDGTVWEIIPGVKEHMYPHQCEAFEFLWTNLAGGIILNKLKGKKELPGASGCLISHAPGTGKTRLTIMFLQSYMELYPNCRPIIIAPKGILGTWEEEFKTWEVDIPFHNMNSADGTDKVREQVMNLVSGRNASNHVLISYCRMAKLHFWRNEKSILGISYNLFEQLTKKGSDERKFLLEVPGLVVLDEGHTPRNSKSFIWKSVSEIRTTKRIILSGTPFQNNFDELYNTLCLARPQFTKCNPSGSKVLCNEKLESLRNESKGRWAYLTSSLAKVTGIGRRSEILQEIRNMICPFVHVHHGTILQESLPGLRKLVVTLKPTNLQKEVFEDIRRKRNRTLAQGNSNVLKLEYEESLTAVHPSLYGLSEGQGVDLQRFRLNPEEGAKTKFLMELIRLCEIVKEKVLVFSQYIDPLKLLASQLEYHFCWKEGTDVLQLHGKVDAKLRQTSINAFNDPNSEVKVMLASTKACYEGISLVGASRVVLLDVVWNPSVERQAISRAYRLGQKKFVYTYHLITAGTRDEEKCYRQAEKDHMSNMVFFNSGRDQHCHNVSSAELGDQILEDMIQHKKIGHIFEKVAVNYEETNSNLKEDFFPLLV